MGTNSHFPRFHAQKSRIDDHKNAACELLKLSFAKLKSSFNFGYDGNGESGEMTLDMVPKNGLARVVAVESDDSHNLRLMEMGLVPGAAIRMVKAAPLGDPIQVCVRNYDLALRRAEAKSIVVSLDEK